MKAHRLANLAESIIKPSQENIKDLRFKEQTENLDEAIPTAVISGFRTGVVDGKTNEIVFHGTKPQAMSAMKKLNGKNLKRYFLASLTPSHKLGGKWPGGTPSWVKAESVENLDEVGKIGDVLNFKQQQKSGLHLMVDTNTDKIVAIGSFSDIHAKMSKANPPYKYYMAHAKPNSKVGGIHEETENVGEAFEDFEEGTLN